MLRRTVIPVVLGCFLYGVGPALLDLNAVGTAVAQTANQEGYYRSPYDPRPTPEEEHGLDRRERERRADERREARERRLSEELLRQEDRRRAAEAREARRLEEERWADEAARRAERERIEERRRKRYQRENEERWAALQRYDRMYPDGRPHRPRRKRFCLDRRRIAAKLAKSDLHVHTWIPRGKRYRVIAHNSKADRYDLIVTACTGAIIRIQRTKQAGRRGVKGLWRKIRKVF